MRDVSLRDSNPDYAGGGASVGPSSGRRGFDYLIVGAGFAGSVLAERLAAGLNKRVLVVAGEPVPYALARIPGAGDFRGNLAKGGTGVGVELSERDRWIVGQVAPELVRRGILFAGLDVIGDWLTEVNVTSPTCIRELDAQYGLNIAGDLFDAMEALRD